MTTDVIKRQRQAIFADRWDRLSFQSAYDTIDALPRLSSELEDINWSAPPLVEDLWQGLYQMLPRQVEEVDPSYRPNQAVYNELSNCPAWNELRANTVDDKFTAALAAVSMSKQLTETLTRLRQAQEAADEAQRALDEARDAEQSGSDDDLDALLERAQVAQEHADQVLDGQAPAIGKFAREAVEQAAEQAQENAQNAAGWGLTPGELASMDPAQRLALADQMRSSNLQRIMAKLGRLKNLYWGEHQHRFNPQPDELHDVELGNDINRLLASEYAGLVIPELTWDFYRRYSERQLLQYELRSTEKVGKGGIVYLHDSSGSMAGDKDDLASALGLALQDIASKERREFNAYLFGGPGQVHHYPCSTAQERMQYAGAFLNSGGTSWMSPLDAAVAQFQEEFDRTGKVTGDILLATDGIADVDDSWLASFREAQERLKFKVYAVSIGQPPTPTLEKLSDFATEIVDLMSFQHLGEVFKRI